MDYRRSSHAIGCWNFKQDNGFGFYLFSDIFPYHFCWFHEHTFYSRRRNKEWEKIDWQCPIYMQWNDIATPTKMTQVIFGWPFVFVGRAGFCYPSLFPGSLSPVYRRVSGKCTLVVTRLKLQAYLLKPQRRMFTISSVIVVQLSMLKSWGKVHLSLLLIAEID